MSSSSIQSKIQVLQARLVEENRSRDRDFSAGLMNSPLRGNQRHGTGGHRPRKLGEIGPPTRPRRQLELPFNAVLPRNRDSAETETKLKQIMKQSGILTINGVKYQTDVKDMEHLGELGNGTCGHVVKMLHKPSGEIIAVKQMRRTGNSEENKRIVMDIDVVLKSYDCPYIVQCLGCFIMESEVWICMELMATCFDKLLKKLKAPIPEHILGKVTVATVKALWYLKEKHDLIHRDVKPSNILLSEKGNVKLCDFGISGRLVDSKAKTKSAGCAAYMAPERIDPPDPTKPDYDIRADVWSLGITLVELALGAFPYQDCKTEFEVVCRIMNETPPSLPNDKNFSEEFQYFVNCCLTKNYQKRPKYPKLLEHPFFKKYEIADVAVDQWFTRIMQETETKPSSAIPRATVASSTTTTSATRNAQRSTPPSPTNRKQHSYHHASTGTPTNLTNGASSNVNPSAFSPPDNYTTFLPSTNERLSSTSASQETRVNVTPNRNMYAQHDNGKSIPAPFNHQIHHDHVGVTQKSPPDRYNILYDRSRTSSSPDRHGLQLTRSRIGNFNTPPEPNSRFSPFYQRRCVGSIANPYSQSPPSSYQEYGPNYTPPTEAVRRTPISSPLLCRKRADSFGKEQNPNVHHNIGNTSPIVLQRFYHQQSQLQKEQSSQEYQHPHFYSHLERRGSGPTTQSDLEAHKDEGKKPYASYFKLQLGSDRRRTQSPDPPPRLSRHAASGDSSQSPLTMRRALLEAACPGSPNLSRRYISPSPPQPPPRRLTESSSVPGSPQHVRARFQYTPEPQRRVYQNNDLS